MYKNGNHDHQCFDKQDLSRNNFCLSSVKFASFIEADLRSTDMRWIKAKQANFKNANLVNANMYGGNFYEADFSGADLSGTYLKNATLVNADLTNTILPFYQIVPSEGNFVAYKAVQGCVLKLLIPYNACRTSNLISRGCRASCVEVLEIRDHNGKIYTGRCFSRYDGSVTYKAGHMTTATYWDDDIRVESTSGIHFFVTQLEAKLYNE